MALGGTRGLEILYVNRSCGKQAKNKRKGPLPKVVELKAELCLISISSYCIRCGIGSNLRSPVLRRSQQMKLSSNSLMQASFPQRLLREEVKDRRMPREEFLQDPSPPLSCSSLIKEGTTELLAPYFLTG
ncbi:Hypothetical predicted protein [Podarcis lilfordi]|uniref:Uncharacterized protein n=1 Tax=Podarcis lilfordi TaxID=74358 RepID=A0AA35KYT0_9SAUR|nr:Hypothetical predicted protein [Podarcis lilfordi]